MPHRRDGGRGKRKKSNPQELSENKKKNGTEKNHTETDDHS